MDFQKAISTYTELGIAYLPKILLAIITLIIGFWIIKIIINLLLKSLDRTSIDTTLKKFLGSLASIALKIMLLLSVVSMFGVNTTSFIAVISALMIGVGMALNGTIGQLASGVMLMIFKPFKVGDLVTIGSGKTATVEAINAFNTTLLTLDNKKIIIGNSSVTANDITNISGQGTVGVELSFDIDYKADIDEARKAILDVGKECPYIIDSPAQGVVVAALKDSAIQLNSRPFCKSEHYWDTLFYMNENVKKTFDKRGINIPYPHMTVNLNKE